MSKTIRVILIFCICSSVLYGSDWKRETEKLILKGQFSSADSLMESLPQKEKAKYYVDIDSFRTIMERIRMDFSLSREDGIKLIRKQIPDITAGRIEDWKNKKFIETMEIDGTERWFRKAIRNLWLLNNELPDSIRKISDKATPGQLARIKYAEKAISCKPDSHNTRNWHNARIRFTLDVKPNAVPAGEKIKVWLPFPLNSSRQKKVQLLYASDSAVISKNSEHHTVYIEKTAVKDSITHFEILFSYDVGAQYFNPDEIIKNLVPYNKLSEQYIKYTSPQPPHIVVNDKIKAIADSIIGNEKNPVLQASMIYDWVDSRFPWAGAREYSTIHNIPEYVLGIKHGDCGQVSLLYISLLRSIGIPARWESGWMLHPGEKNLHDWTEIYFEGTGWIPCDMSFGIMHDAENPIIGNYYKTGTDIYRMATNSNIGMPLYPEKKYIRSETVDFQLGEVEWNGGNIYYPDWKSTLTIENFTPISELNK